MGFLHLIYLEKENIYVCSNCSIHLSTKDDIISKSFQARHGKGYLFHTVYGFILYSVNINLGHLEDRQMSTGLHTVCDVYCKFCLTTIGWKYV
jgi:hypothetical protein